MTVQSKSWEMVGKKFESIGTHLRGRFDEVSKDAAADRAALEKALQALLSAIEDTLATAGKAATDPVLRTELTALAASMREALLATFDAKREQLSAAAHGRPAVTEANRPPATKATARGRARAKAVASKPVAHRADLRKPAASKRPSA